MAQLAFWRFNKDSRYLENCIEANTLFKGLPALYAGDNLTDNEFIKAIDKYIPEDYSGLVLGNFSEKRTASLYRPKSTRQDILYWGNLWRVFRERRPGCQLVNYAMPGIPYWTPSGGYGSVIDYIIDNNCEGIPHWFLWNLIDGASISVYDPYDSDESGKGFTKDQIHKRNKAYIELLEEVFPGRPKVINFWHRHSNGKDKFKLIDFEELWDEQIKDFINLSDEYILCFWGALTDKYFRQSPEKELFFKNTADEHKNAGVNISSKEECDSYYEYRFTELANTLSKYVGINV